MAGTPQHSRKHKDRYSTPKKGTKKRQLVLALLNPKGIKTSDMKELGFKDSGAIENLRNDCGFDVQIIDQQPSPSGKGRPTNVYRIIGRYRWKGGYRSFLES